jgi:hypothetical protein
MSLINCAQAHNRRAISHSQLRRHHCLLVPVRDTPARPPGLVTSYAAAARRCSEASLSISANARYAPARTISHSRSFGARVFLARSSHRPAFARYSRAFIVIAVDPFPNGPHRSEVKSTHGEVERLPFVIDRWVYPATMMVSNAPVASAFTTFIYIGGRDHQMQPAPQVRDAGAPYPVRWDWSG